MPKLLSRAPKYALHKASGRAVVKIGGKLHYLGPYGSAESKLEYRRVVSAWSAEQAGKTVAAGSGVPESDTTLAELLAAYLQHAESYYRKDGRPTSMLFILRSVARLWKPYATAFVRDVKPSHLKTIQATMVKDGQSRSYVNKVTSYSKMIFRWATENDLAPAGVWQSLLAVRGLAKGRTKAREPEPVGPVDDVTVDATAPYLPPVVQDMVAFQRHTGARPGEVCSIRPCDVDRSGDVWLYRPESHKCQHHDRGRVIAIGPRAQEILLPYLLRDATAFCFSPRDSEARRNAVRRDNRKTPMTPSQTARTPRRCPRRPAKDRYTKDSYCRAIARACDLAFPPPPPLGRLEGESTRKWRERLTEVQSAELKAWQAAHRWSQNQLRHSAGTDVRKRFGLEAAQVVLGHAKANTTEIYAERDLRLAVEIARQVG